MLQAIKSVRIPPPPLQYFPRRKIAAAVVKFRRVTTSCKEENMEKNQNPNEKTGDPMSHSFGEGYATRSDEEGFGGIYSGNQSINNIEDDKKIHENHPAYDKTQGSEVKEKEKGRNSPNTA